MDIDKNIIVSEVLTSSNDISFPFNGIDTNFKTEFVKKNLANYSNSNLSKKINNLSKTLGQTNINTLNIFANNLSKNNNTSLTTSVYPSTVEVSTTDMNLTENNDNGPTENSIGLNLNTNHMDISNINNSNSFTSSDVTSFTTTANPIPIPVNSSSFHSSENKNLTTYSFINSLETPTTLSIDNIKEHLNSADHLNTTTQNMNSISLYYPSDFEFNNSLNSNHLSALNSSILTLQSQRQQQQQQQQQHQQSQQSQPSQQSSTQLQPPTFITASTANPQLSHEQAKNISFSSFPHLSSTTFSNGKSTNLLNNNSYDNYSCSSATEKSELNLPTSLTSLDTESNKANVDMDMNLDMDYNSNMSELSNISSSIPPPPPPPSQASSDINSNSLDLNTMLSNQISNLHIHSLLDLNSQEGSSSTSTAINIPSTNETLSDVQFSSSSFTEGVSYLTTTATTTATSKATVNSTNPLNSSSYSTINNSLKLKTSNPIIYRKNYIKKPQSQQYSYPNKYSLSSSLKLVKKEPGTKINFVKKKINMKSNLSSSLDTKLSNIDLNDLNKKYGNNILHTPRHSNGYDNENSLVSPSFVITSPDHISKPLDNYDLSKQVQQVPVSVVPHNNSYSGNKLFVRSSTLAIPTRKIRSYGYDSQPLSSSLTTKTIQNQHIVSHSLSEDFFSGNSNSNSLTYKYNPSSAIHKGYFSLTSQLDILNEKRKKRKESHNATERRRRDFINEKIYELSTLIPESFFDQCLNESKHKGVILQKSVDYINHLIASLKAQQEYTSRLEKEINNHSSTTQSNK